MASESSTQPRDEAMLGGGEWGHKHAEKKIDVIRDAPVSLKEGCGVTLKPVTCDTVLNESSDLFKPGTFQWLRLLVASDRDDGLEGIGGVDALLVSQTLPTERFFWGLHSNKSA